MGHPLSDPSIEKSVQDVAGQLDDVQLVDVRETYEWDAGRIAQARHLELERLSSGAATIDKDQPVVFACRGGVRSLMAAQAFRRAGYEAYSMTGGMVAWDAAGLSMVPEGATVADH